MKRIMMIFSLLMMSVLLFACSDSETITVTFTGHDGVAIETVTFTRGEQPELSYPEVPIVPGYLFVGWTSALEMIEEDTTIAAIYVKIESGEALEQLLSKVLESENYKEYVTVYVNGNYERTIIFERDFDRIYMSLQRVNAEEIRLMIDAVEGEYIGYEYQVDQWISAPLTEAQYRHVRFTHSQRRMLPIEFNIDWFNVTENRYTVKVTEFNNMLEYIPMAGHFNAYELIVQEDALLLNIEIYDQTFSLVRYEIKFYDFDVTTVESINLD